MNQLFTSDMLRLTSQLLSEDSRSENIFHEAPFGEGGLNQIQSHEGREDIPHWIDKIPKSEAQDNEDACDGADYSFKHWSSMCNNDLDVMQIVRLTTAGHELVQLSAIAWNDQRVLSLTHSPSCHRLRQE